MNSEARKNFILNVCFYLLVILLCCAVLRLLLPWFWPFLFGLALAYLFHHLSAPLVSTLHLRGKPVTAVIALLFYLAVVLLFWTIAVLLTGQLVEAAQWFPDFYRESILPAATHLGSRLLSLLGSLAPAFAISVSELFDFLSAAMGDLATGISSSLLGFLSRLLRRLPLFLIGFVFMIVSSFYIGMDYSRITGFLMRQFPGHLRGLVLDVKNFLVSCLLRLLRAYLLIMLVTFSELAIGLWALRVEGFWKIAALVAVLDLLPLIGSGAVLIPWGIYLLAAESYPLGFGILTLYGIITVVRNVIEPRIVGDQLGLHPVVTLAAMFFGLRVLGVTGIFIAPVIALLIRYLNNTGSIRLYRR